jgi:hypothetical protein
MKFKIGKEIGDGMGWDRRACGDSICNLSSFLSLHKIMAQRKEYCKALI